MGNRLGSFHRYLLGESVMPEPGRFYTKSTFRTLRPVPTSLTDFLVIQNLRKMLENKLDAFGHGNTKRPGNAPQCAG